MMGIREKIFINAFLQPIGSMTFIPYDIEAAEKIKMEGKRNLRLLERIVNGKIKKDKPQNP